MAVTQTYFKLVILISSLYLTVIFLAILGIWSVNTDGYQR
jgi:hypothetical protein